MSPHAMRPRGQKDGKRARRNAAVRPFLRHFVCFDMPPSSVLFPSTDICSASG